MILKTESLTDFHSYHIIFLSASVQTGNTRLGDHRRTLRAIAQHAPVTLISEKKAPPPSTVYSACQTVSAAERDNPPKIHNRAIFLFFFFFLLLPRLPSRSDAHTAWRGGTRPGEGRIKARLLPSRVAARTKHQERQASLANSEVVQREFWGEVTVGVLLLYCSAE